MRGSTLQDNRVYYPHTVSLLNIADDRYLDWSRTQDGAPYLLAGLTGLPEYDGARLQEYTQATVTPDASFQEARLRAELEQAGITDRTQQDAFIQIRAASQNPQLAARQDLVARAAALFAGTETMTAVTESRAVREFLYTRDHPTPNTRCLSSLWREAEDAGDIASAERFREDLAAMRDLGLSDLRVMTDLPVMLCAIGYSRWMPEHRRVRTGEELTASLRLFPQHQNRHPIYTAENTTEGLLFTLDPYQWAAWLAENDAVALPEPGFADEPAARAWLIRLMPQFLSTSQAYLQRQPWEENVPPVHAPTALSFGLLHSMSHLFLSSAQSCVGFQTDSLAEYLFPIAGSGLIYAGGHKEYTLGGIVSVFQQDMLQWLRGARETAYRCLLDPLCRQKGGACHTCIYLRFSCQHYNRTLSRSFLTGGRVAGHAEVIVGYWSSRVRTRAAALRAAGAGMGRGGRD
jgi:hypothetical protein